MQVEESCCEKLSGNKFWLCRSFFTKIATCLGSTLSKSTNQRAAFLQPTTNVSLARQVDHAIEVKNAKHRPKTCNETMLSDKLRAFVSCHKIQKPSASLRRRNDFAALMPRTLTLQSEITKTIRTWVQQWFLIQKYNPNVKNSRRYSVPPSRE